jgi:hypothetical protein
MSNAHAGTVTAAVTADDGVETALVTATVTSGAQPASDTPTVAEFMSAVVAWPGPQEPGHINLHYSMPNPRPNPKQPFLKGLAWPYRDVNKRVSRAARVNTVADKFFCTSSGFNKRGYPKAPRLAANALKQKSMWIDIDVGNDPRNMATEL